MALERSVLSTMVFHLRSGMADRLDDLALLTLLGAKADAEVAKRARDATVFMVCLRWGWIFVTMAVVTINKVIVNGGISIASVHVSVHLSI